MPPKPFITLDRITVRVSDQWLLRGLSWQINAGENWVIWGPNGAGKTTLAKALMDQVPVVEGGIRRHYAQNGDHAPPLALISSEQHTHLYLREQLLEDMSHFSANPNLATSAGQVLDRVAGHDSQQPDKVVQNLGLESMLSKQISALSTGEMRKLLIGRALIRQPRLLILDEPFNGLDKGFQHRFKQILNKMMGDGVQMVLITHRPAEIPSYFSHLLHLQKNKIRWRGKIADFFTAMDDSNPTPEAPEPAKAVAPAPQSPPLTALAATPLVTMRNVTVRYHGENILDNVSWTVSEGENWAITGPNGAGKSTLLQLITGDNLQAYANELILFGRPKGSGESVWEIKQLVGYVSDAVHLRYQKKMSAFDVVCSGFFDSIGLYRCCSPSQRQTARQWFETTAAQDLSRRLYNKLSFGQQRMILILRAVVKTPRLLILDEPCNGLDPTNRQRLLGILDVIGLSKATNLLYVSHREDEMPTCITHRLRLDDGRVVAGRF